MFIKNQEVEAKMTWDMDKILKETDGLYQALDFMLSEFNKGSDTHGIVYLRTVKRMEATRLYSTETIDFFRHCYDSAENVRLLNQTDYVRVQDD